MKHQRREQGCEADRGIDRGAYAASNRRAGQVAGRVAERMAACVRAARSGWRAALIVLFLAALVAGGTMLAGSGIAKAGSTSTTTTSPAATSADSSTTTSITLTGEVKQQVDELQAQAAGIQSEIAALDGQLEQATESYNQLCLQLDAIDKSLAELRREQGIAQKNQDYHVKVLGERLAAMYKAGGREQYLEILLSASGLSDFASRLRFVVTMATEDNQLISDTKTSNQELADFLKQIDAQKQTDLDLRKQINDQAQVIQAKLAERATTLAGVQAQVATIVEQERQRQQQEAIQLQQELEAQQQAAQEASAAGFTFMGASGALPLSNDPAANQLVETAAAYLGTPYVWAGDRPSTGFDCSGFTQYVFAQHGVNLPHYSVYQSQMGTAVDPHDLHVGDLLCFGLPVHHVGIYIGGGQFIHAPGTGQFVRISLLSERHDLERHPSLPDRDAHRAAGEDVARGGCCDDLDDRDDLCGMRGGACGPRVSRAQCLPADAGRERGRTGGVRPGPKTHDRCSNARTSGNRTPAQRAGRDGGHRKTDDLGKPAQLPATAARAAVRGDHQPEEIERDGRNAGSPRRTEQPQRRQPCGPRSGTAGVRRKSNRARAFRPRARRVVCE